MIKKNEIKNRRGTYNFNIHFHFDIGTLAIGLKFLKTWS